MKIWHMHFENDGVETLSASPPPYEGNPPVTGGFNSPSHKYINSKPGQAVEQTIEMHNMLTYIQADLACDRIHYDAHIDA